jgi:hypothetical protein
MTRKHLQLFRSPFKLAGEQRKGGLLAFAAIALGITMASWDVLDVPNPLRREYVPDPEIEALSVSVKNRMHAIVAALGEKSDSETGPDNGKFIQPVQVGDEFEFGIEAKDRFVVTAITDWGRSQGRDRARAYLGMENPDGSFAGEAWLWTNNCYRFGNSGYNVMLKADTGAADGNVTLLKLVVDPYYQLPCRPLPEITSESYGCMPLRPML